jgi:hypothetical protein
VKDHPPGSALALAAAIVSLPLAWLPLLGGPLAVLAVILAWNARRLVRATPDAFRESAMPSAAQVIGIIGVVLAALAFVAWTVLMSMVALGASHPPAAVADPLLF